MGSYNQLQHLSTSDHCLICLGSIVDRTILNPCKHSDYCFKCVLIWIKQSHRCPLCSTKINHLIHLLNLNDQNFERYFPLPILPSIFDDDQRSTRNVQGQSSSTPPSNRSSTITDRNISLSSPFINATCSNPSQTKPTTKAQEIDSSSRKFYGLDRRISVYKNLLYSKHIPSNKFTGFRPTSPKKLSKLDQKDWMPRTTRFLRRELKVLSELRELNTKKERGDEDQDQDQYKEEEIDYRISYVLKILPVLDCKSEGCIRILTDLLDGDLDKAQLFAHELSSFLRSPFQDLEPWDDLIQYPQHLK